MTKQQMYTKENLENMYPHLVNVYKEELTKAYNEFILSDKFLEKRDEFKDKDEYKDRLAVQKITLEFFEKNLNTLKGEIEESDNEVNYTLFSYILNKLTHLDKYWYIEPYILPNTKEESVEKAISTTLSNIEESFVKENNEYTERLAMDYFQVDISYFKKSSREKLIFIMQSTPIIDESEFENKIKEGFNFNEEIFVTEEDKQISWKTEYDGSNSEQWIWI